MLRTIFYLTLSSVLLNLPAHAATPDAALAASTDWATCAPEGGQCVFPTRLAVRYGSGTTFVYGNSAAFDCSNATFGDPTPGVVKHCEASKSANLPPTYGAWHFCSAEAQQCGFSGTHTVAYGSGGTYTLRRFSTGVDCANSVFGDPTPGVVKQCYYADLPDNPSFENPDIANYEYSPADSGWLYSTAQGNGGAGIEHNGGDFGASNAPDGVQAAFLQNYGIFSQIIPNLNVGTYALRFSAARRGGANYGPQTFEVLLNGTVVGAFTVSSTAFTSFTTDQVFIDATDPTIPTILFRGIDGSGDNTAFIDEITLLND